MSLFSRLFGGGGDEPPPRRQDSSQSTAGAIEKIKTTIDLLQKKADYLDKKIEGELKQAKAYGTKSKQKALIHLKRKKRYEKQQENILGTISTLDIQMTALEGQSTTAMAFEAVSEASHAMKINQPNIDKVQDTMDDVQDQMADAEEVSQVLSNPTFGEQYDEDDLLGELEEFEQEELDEQLMSIGSTDATAFPDAPVADLPAKPAKVEDDELDMLSAWAEPS